MLATSHDKLTVGLEKRVLPMESDFEQALITFKALTMASLNATWQVRLLHKEKKRILLPYDTVLFHCQIRCPIAKFRV